MVAMSWPFAIHSPTWCKELFSLVGYPTSNSCKSEVIPPGMMATSVLWSLFRCCSKVLLRWQQNASKTRRLQSFFRVPLGALWKSQRCLHPIIAQIIIHPTFLLKTDSCSIQKLHNFWMGVPLEYDGGGGGLCPFALHESKGGFFLYQLSALLRSSLPSCVWCIQGKYLEGERRLSCIPKHGERGHQFLSPFLSQTVGTSKVCPGDLSWEVVCWYESALSQIIHSGAWNRSTNLVML